MTATATSPVNNRLTCSMAACVDETSTSRSSLQFGQSSQPEAGAGQPDGGTGDDDGDQQDEGDGGDGPVAPGRDPHADEATSWRRATLREVHPAPPSGLRYRANR